jgi:predicted PurR-regulated permease PerM
LFAAYYSFINWDSLVKLVSRFIPFDKKTSVIKEIKNSTDGIIHGYLLLALIEFVVSAAGFYLSGVQYYLLLSFIIAILVFIPGLGAIAVIIPMLIYYFVLGNWYSFIGVLITGIIVSFFIEIILSAKLLSEDSAVHPMIMLLGILGGTAVFGLFGFIIGPLVLVYTLKILKDLLSRI